MDWNQKELEELYQKINQLTATDADFRKALQEDAYVAIEKVAGKKLPEGFRLETIETDPSYGKTFMAPNFTPGELNLQALKTVAGGQGEEQSDSSSSSGDVPPAASTSFILIVSACAAAAGPCAADACVAEACGWDGCPTAGPCAADACVAETCVGFGEGPCGGFLCGADACVAEACGWDGCPTAGSCAAAADA